MKRLFALALTALCFCLTLPASAAHAETVVNESVEYFADGSSCITIITCASSRAALQKSAAKEVIYRGSDDTKLFSLTVHGTFKYDGSSATCIDASYTYNVYDSAWSFKSATASKSGATATASGTFVKKVLGITVATKALTPTLTCDKDGNLS